MRHSPRGGRGAAAPGDGGGAAGGGPAAGPRRPGAQGVLGRPEVAAEGPAVRGLGAPGGGQDLVPSPRAGPGGLGRPRGVSAAPAGDGAVPRPGGLSVVPGCRRRCAALLCCTRREGAGAPASGRAADAPSAPGRGCAAGKRAFLSW